MKNPFKNPAPIAPTSAEPKNASAAKARVAPVVKGTLVKKKNTAAGGATGTTGARSFTTATSGARYGIRVKFQKTTAPEASSTQANGRIIPPATNRSKPNFTSGMAE